MILSFSQASDFKSMTKQLEGGFKKKISTVVTKLRDNMVAQVILTFFREAASALSSYIHYMSRTLSRKTATQCFPSLYLNCLPRSDFAYYLKQQFKGMADDVDCLLRAFERIKVDEPSLVNERFRVRLLDPVNYTPFHQFTDEKIILIDNAVSLTVTVDIRTVALFKVPYFLE